jgi:hypothetical protein
VYVYVFIGVDDHTYMSICICTEFLKKKNLHLFKKKKEKAPVCGHSSIKDKA